MLGAVLISLILALKFGCHFDVGCGEISRLHQVLAQVWLVLNTCKGVHQDLVYLSQAGPSHFAESHALSSHCGLRTVSAYIFLGRKPTTIYIINQNQTLWVVHNQHKYLFKIHCLRILVSVHTTPCSEYSSCILKNTFCQKGPRNRDSVQPCTLILWDDAQYKCPKKDNRC